MYGYNLSMVKCLIINICVTVWGCPKLEIQGNCLGNHNFFHKTRPINS